ncbi:carbamoyl-phosphate synthase (glutamine-hydrolyzing) large subunit [Virgibacillus siamensis]|uniref:carbamoyl-phosphate synthase (glutamine-hydrolyzing) large subunit n=1 Tax=Virgibacillus siamensis TaxID=480071 RepID=UPI0009871453|nr:carbamoyl-phosphate synthase (glutamine-hydrolyzing) large subunit [Virgibacillus siamensis]
MKAIGKENLNKGKKVLVIGSGPIIIGQAAEFDYSGTQACLALKEEGMEVVLLNNNPATIMTDETVADSIYMEPMTVQTIENIFQKEQPDCLIGTFGGQIGLNLTMNVCDSGLLEKYGVQLMGSSMTTIQNGEDRDKFRQLMHELGEPVPESHIISSIEFALDKAADIGYPVMVRPAYTLGGSGGGFAADAEELRSIVASGLQASPINQVLLEKSIKGWQEIEFEVIRDMNNDCVIVCGMENVDPVGVHTGDSIVVAPVQTLQETAYAKLRTAAVRIIQNLGVVGACNIQFALDPATEKYNVIEVNPRVSRSSALASKATACPIAKLSAKCALGHSLDSYFPEKNSEVYDVFIDYTVLKMPRFSFEKFPSASRKLGTQMKATGETMAIDFTFEGALNKAVRSLDSGLADLSHPMIKGSDESILLEHMTMPTDLRLFAIAELLRRGKSVNEIYHKTKISQPFLTAIQRIVSAEENLKNESLQSITAEKLLEAKQMQISNEAIAAFLDTTKRNIQAILADQKLAPSYEKAKSVNQVPYYFSTWEHVSNQEKEHDSNNVLIIGSGPIRIGQGMEFDYCTVHGIYALKDAGYTTIIINNNPETVSTDSSIADRLYFEPLTPEDILSVIQEENVSGVMIQFGGQTAINLAKELADAGITIYGTPVEMVDVLEDRQHFYQLLNELKIPHIEGKTADTPKEIETCVHQIGYPVLVRPSYVIGGQSMHVIHNEKDLAGYLDELVNFNGSAWPILVDKYADGVEAELDCVSDGENVMIPGIMEHIEKAGVHSGDSMATVPPVSISKDQQHVMLDYTKSICKHAKVVGLINIQFIIVNGIVHVLEVNPRASRTVPLISKVTGVSLVHHAVQTQLGNPLKNDIFPGEFESFTVKAPAFSSFQLAGVDPVLGPEMKSTGEIIGIAKTYNKALAKAMQSTGAVLAGNTEKPYLFCSIADEEKAASLPLMHNMNSKYQLFASQKTSAFLAEHGIFSHSISGTEALIGVFEEQTLAGSIIISSGFQEEGLGRMARDLSVLHQVPLFTCLDTLNAAVESAETATDSVSTLKEYHQPDMLMQKSL